MLTFPDLHNHCFVSKERGEFRVSPRFAIELFETGLAGIAQYNCHTVPEVRKASWARMKRGFAAAEELYSRTNHQ